MVEVLTVAWAIPVLAGITKIAWTLQSGGNYAPEATLHELRPSPFGVREPFNHGEVLASVLRNSR